MADTDIWRMAAIGLVIAAIAAVVTGIAVASRTGPMDIKVAAPAAASATVSRGTPPQSVVAECTRVAGDVSGPEQGRSETRYRSAYVGCMKSKGYTS